MSKLKKYPSILNYYREAELAWWIKRYPELNSTVFEVTEKIHGSNFQLHFEPGKPVRVGSRKEWVPEGSSGLYGVWDVLDREVYQQLIIDYNLRTIEFEESYTFYGELFGPSVQKGVDYGVKKRILFFEMRIDDIMVSPTYMRLFFRNHDHKDLLVPRLWECTGLAAVLALDVELESIVHPGEGNIMEGIVAKPRDRVYTTEQGSIFRIKKKSERFKEKASVKKPREPLPDAVLALHAEFERYITLARLDCIISNHGPIQNKDIGKYIKLLVEDAREEFDSKHAVDKKDRKSVYNVGKLAYSIIARRVCGEESEHEDY